MSAWEKSHKMYNTSTFISILVVIETTLSYTGFQDSESDKKNAKMFLIELLYKGYSCLN